MVINRHGIVIVNYKIAVRGGSIRRYKLTLIINFKLICHIVVDNIAAFFAFCIANFHKTVFTLEQILNCNFAILVCCKLACVIYSIIIVFIRARRVLIVALQLKDNIRQIFDFIFFTVCLTFLYQRNVTFRGAVLRVNNNIIEPFLKLVSRCLLTNLNSRHRNRNKERIHGLYNGIRRRCFDNQVHANVQVFKLNKTISIRFSFRLPSLPLTALSAIPSFRFAAVLSPGVLKKLSAVTALSSLAAS